MVAARFRDYYDKQARERMDATRLQGDQPPAQANFPERDHGQARDAAGKEFGVSGKSVDHVGVGVETTYT